MLQAVRCTFLLHVLSLVESGVSILNSFFYPFLIVDLLWGNNICMHCIERNGVKYQERNVFSYCRKQTRKLGQRKLDVRMRLLQFRVIMSLSMWASNWPRAFIFYCSSTVLLSMESRDEIIYWQSTSISFPSFLSVLCWCVLVPCPNHKHSPLVYLVHRDFVFAHILHYIYSAVLYGDYSHMQKWCFCKTTRRLQSHPLLRNVFTCCTLHTTLYSTPSLAYLAPDIYVGMS